MGIVELREEVISEAQDLVFRASIKTLDSIHLASAIILKQIIETSYPFVTSDKQLAVAAEKEGFERTTVTKIVEEYVNFGNFFTKSSPPPDRIRATSL